MTEGIPNHFEVIRSLPPGHVMAILETIKKLGLDKIISEKSSRIRNLVVAMIVARIIISQSRNHLSNDLSELSRLWRVSRIPTRLDEEKERVEAERKVSVERFWGV